MRAFVALIGGLWAVVEGEDLGFLEEVGFSELSARLRQVQS
jgi:hypothetical protein